MADRTDDTRSASEIGGELMTTRYVGIGGNDANDGLSWANRKLTLNGVEDTPVQAGDTVYVGPGTYYGLGADPVLTVDVSGSSGSPITYIADVDGSHTDGVGGCVCLTGLAEDKLTYVTGYIISATGKSYRTFDGFLFDGAVYSAVRFVNTQSNVTIQNCIFLSNNGNNTIVSFADASSDHVIQNCIFICGYKGGTGNCISIESSNEVNDKTFTVSNCLFIGMNSGVYSLKCGNVTVKNSTFFHTRYGCRTNAVNVTYPMIANNNVLYGCNTAFYAAAAGGQIVEDYNNINGCDVARTNVNAGAHSLAYPALFDTRWAQELLWNGGTMVSPFDLSSISGLLNVAGTSPTTTDIRGTTVQGAQREWGALEYDSTLDIEAGAGGTSSVKIMPLGKVGL